MNTVVLCGGLSFERDVSLCTGSLVVKALLSKGHNAVLADVIEDIEISDKDYKKYIETCREREERVFSVPKIAPDIDKIRAEVLKKGEGTFGKNILNLCMAADIVFMALHGEDGEDGKIQAALDLMNVKYTGAGYLGSAVAMSKKYTKQVFTVNDILSPDYMMLKKDEYSSYNLDDIKLPCVVKLNSGGSSIGVYIVNEKQELKKCIDEAFLLEDELVIEEYIKGQEFTCGVFADKGLPIVQITPKDGFYDYEHKYQEGRTEEICPAPLLDEKQTKQMQEISVKVHKALGLEVYSRVDFIMDDRGDFYCLEANTLPGMTPTSLLPQEAAADGVGYEDFCDMIIEESLKKYK